jgi:formylmethanofuran dehydrogenase subunit E
MGKSAATFVLTGGNKAVRVSAGKKFKQPENMDIAEFYAGISDDELFRIQWVNVEIKPEDMPGKPTMKAVCSKCGEQIVDNRHVLSGADILCRCCADGGYYTPVI